VAIGQVVIANHERIVALKACSKGLILETLRYNYEVRKAEKYFEDIPSNAESEKDQMDLAMELIKRKSGDFDPTKFKDLYQEGLKEIIEAKMEKRAPRVKGEKRPTEKVISIMDALRKSLAQSKGGQASESTVENTPKKAAPRKPAAKKRTTKKKQAA
jgi:DNA end-binding protein Ku